MKASHSEFVGIFDAIAPPETYARDRHILAQWGGRHLACLHPFLMITCKRVNVKTGMICAVNDVAALVFRDFVTPALQICRAGVSATKLVVEL